MQYSELWTARDEEAAQQLLEAVAAEDLLGACLAIEGHDDPPQMRAELARWGAELQDQIQADPSTPAHQHLQRFLGHHRDLRGDAQDYYHPRNSFVSQVMERRQGLPILLSTVWILVGNQVGIPVEGVGMPGHFLVRVRGEEPLYFDPFDRGKQLTEAQCRQIVDRLSQGGLAWRDEFLNPTPTAEIAERILRNLVNAFASREDVFGLYRILRLFSALRPDRHDLLLQQGRIAQVLEFIPAAIEAYQTFIARAPHPKAVAQIQEIVDELLESNHKTFLN